MRPKVKIPAPKKNWNWTIEQISERLEPALLREEARKNVAEEYQKKNKVRLPDRGMTGKLVERIADASLAPKPTWEESRKSYLKQVKTDEKAEKKYHKKRLEKEMKTFEDGGEDSDV